MFFTELDAKRYENQPRGMEARQKEGLWALLRPVLGERRRYARRMEVLRDVRAGLLSPTAAEKELNRLEQRRRAATVTGAVELSAEGLERMAQRLERSCERLERSCELLEERLGSWSEETERSLRGLEAALRGR